MFSALLNALFGSANDRVVNRFKATVQQINALEATIAPLSDAALQAKTAVFKDQLSKGKTLNDILPEAFAVVREASKRTLGLRPFDVQLIGGIVLHNGMISEMKTGEGKTLVSALPAYLNALTGKGVHIVTVNDYLAKRDAEWMGKIHRFLGLSVGCIVNGLNDTQRREQYACDITYATNNELGFDYLRDNMKFTLQQMAQRPLHYAIVDEVDSILIDEARTPLIISGPAESSSELYIKVNAVLKNIPATAYEIDEKQKNLTMSEDGQEQIEKVLQEGGLITTGGLYDTHNISLLHHVQQALNAQYLFVRDRDYIVKDNRVIIIDEFSGRMMEGRRYSNGLHQAIEAKENVPVQLENQTLASITFQNYFRMYEKLGGMTGTAMTEAPEFEEIYNLRAVEVPTNVKPQRIDEHDIVFRTEAEKIKAITALIEERHAKKQPILVGTVSIAKSEELAAHLKKKKIPHAVLNARYHEQEAAIIAQAGRLGAVTIATNMAGRGTDIQLGGNLEKMLEEAGEDKAEAVKAQYAADKQAVIEAGGLYVIGTERHESRRIDNQLRGRSGRQGDKGHSLFYISLEDDLMRIFGSERIDGVLKTMGLKEDEPITHPLLNKALERAQKKVEARNFDIRKTLLKFDDVMNDQRKVIYEQRREIMQSTALAEVIDEFREEIIETIVHKAMPQGTYPEQWDIEGLSEDVKRLLAVDAPVHDWAKEEGVAEGEVIRRLSEMTAAIMAAKRSTVEPHIRHHAEKSLLLQIFDQEWKDHLLALDHLRQGINLRSYGQKDPLNEYKREAFDYFGAMLNSVKEKCTEFSMRMEIHTEVAQMPEGLPEGMEQRLKMLRHDPFLNADESALPSADEAMPQTRVVRQVEVEFDQNDPSTWGRVQRNAPCPCGSGKKYKQCHGVLV
jgi:preprotein translocase subunit SecA